MSPIDFGGAGGGGGLSEAEVEAIIAGEGLATGWNLASGRYYGLQANSVSTGTQSNGVTLTAPAWFPRSVTIDRIGAEVTTTGEAGSLVRLGAYLPNATTGLPDALLADFGTIDGTSVTFNPITVSQVIPAGIVWFSATFQAATTTRPTMRVISVMGFPQIGGTSSSAQTTAINFSYNGAVTTSGALPSSFTVGSNNNTMPRIQWRIA